MHNTASQNELSMLKKFDPGLSESVPIYPNQHAIFERLETTKQFGLLSDYLVSWSGQAGLLSAKVTVWKKDGAPKEVVRDYIGRLLRGLVDDTRIFVEE
jgi:hypothetical protein